MPASYLDDAPALDATLCQRSGWLTHVAVFEWRALTSARAAGNDIAQWHQVFAETLDGRDTVTKGRCSGDALTLSYPLGLGSETILLAYTPLTYGGERAWFLCPEESCGKRVGKLHWTGQALRCRHCAALSYRSKSEAPYQRGLRAAKKSHARASTLWSWLTYFDAGQMPPRPKGMHQATYDRLCAAHRERFAEWEQVMAAKVATVQGSTARLIERLKEIGG